MSSLPRHSRLVMLAMIPEALGGLKPIGMFAAPYRIWAALGQNAEVVGVGAGRARLQFFFSGCGFTSALDV
eukprot:8086604-Pyramimonas_sp.AAC.1